MKTMTRLFVSCAFLVGAAAAAAQQPVTLTSTADFRKGNNEGLVSPAQERVTRERITAGTVAPWTVTTAMPTERADVTAVAYNGFVYCIGGEGAADEVIYAPMNGDGSLGAWTATTSLPNGRRFHASVTYNGFIYVIAGFDGDFNLAYDDVLVAPINADGALGSWTPTASLPSPRGFHAAAVYNGFVYVTGGWMTGQGANPDVLVAPVNADGTLGAWAATTELPGNRASHSCVAYNGFLYLIGGEQYLANTTAFVAPINADGTIGAWTQTTDLVTGHSAHASVAYNGFVYCIGGDWQVDVSYAPLYADGSIGLWQAAASLPGQRRYLGAVANNGYLYAIGGSFNPDLDTFVAAIDPDVAGANQSSDLLRGSYSHLVDLQSDAANLYLVLNGQVSAGGNVRLQVRLAPDATKIFGAESVIDPAPLGTAINLGAARYAWIRVTLDDSGASDVDQPTYISDMVFSPYPPPTAGAVFDGLAADIDAQVSATTIEANWSGFAPAAGDALAFYEWSIGTSTSLSNVQGWVSVGLATSATSSSLALNPGTTYYVRVRATGAGGLTSTVAASDGVLVSVPVTTPGGGGGGGGGGKHCGHGASAAPGSGLALLVAFALAGLVLRRRRVRA